MRLGRLGYYGDFVIYPTAVAGLAVAGLANTEPARWPEFAGAFLGGFCLWTLAEYVLHRFVLHHVPYVRDMHNVHHEDQLALVGTPTWFSFVLISVIVFAPLYVFQGITLATGVTAGFMLGYLWYVSVHHMVHHWTSKPGSYMHAMKRRHMLHHHFDEQLNFGVSNGFWDKVFRTDVTPAQAAAVAHR